MSGSSFEVTNPSALDDVVEPALEERASAVSAAAAAGTPRLTGRLAAGWNVRRSARGRFDVENDVPYARFVEYGTRRTRPAAMLGRAVAGAGR